jgi:signal-transduction protein with cAMP-binding, CBS, and nucleotidyltransferase domain
MNKLELLQKVPTFARLTNEQLALLARSVGTQTFEHDETIFHQGSIGSTLYIIAHELAHAYLRNGGWGDLADPEASADALAASWGFIRPPVD